MTEQGLLNFHVWEDMGTNGTASSGQEKNLRYRRRAARDKMSLYCFWGIERLFVCGERNEALRELLCVEGKKGWLVILTSFFPFLKSEQSGGCAFRGCHCSGKSNRGCS